MCITAAQGVVVVVVRVEVVEGCYVLMLLWL